VFLYSNTLARVLSACLFVMSICIRLLILVEGIKMLFGKDIYVIAIDAVSPATIYGWCD